MASKLTLQSVTTLPGTTVSMPRLGFGVYQIPAKMCEAACLAALSAGYRHIDSAQLYRNEADVGAAVMQSGIPRSDIFVTTKIGQSKGSPEATYASLLDSVSKAGGGGPDAYVDLFLVHTPMFGPGVRKELWLALERLLAEGKTRAIGVSNYGVEELEEMKVYAKEWPPKVNQIELHPWCQQRQLVSYCQKHNIILQAYSPLACGASLTDPTLVSVAERHGKSPAQVLVRYALQKDWVPLPKTVQPARMQENAEVFDFALLAEDVTALDGLDEGVDGAQFKKNASP